MFLNHFDELMVFDLLIFAIIFAAGFMCGALC